MLNSEIWFRNLTALDSGEVVLSSNDSSNSIGLFNGGGLFLEDSVPASLVSSITNRRCSASSLNTVSCAARSDRCRWIGVEASRRGGGGMFLSVTLSVRGGNGGLGEDSSEILERSGENDVASEAEVLPEIENEKVEKPGIRSGSQQALNVTKHLWAGAVAAMVSRTFVAPLERLKLEYMVRGEQKNLLELVRKIATTQGIKGFWKGNFVNILRTAPFKAINFYSYEKYRDQLLKISGNEEATNVERFIAGAAAGITATVLCIPMDTIRTVMVAPGGEALGGLSGAFRHMIQTEGFFSLYKGLVPSIISMAPSGAVFYGVYDILKSAYLHSPEGRKRLQNLKKQGQELNALEQLELGPIRTLIYGAIAGCCSEAATYPFEVVRRQLQMQVRATKMSALATCAKVVEQGGIPALYAGLTPSLLQVLPSAAISYLVYEFMKIVLEVQ
nr:probable mitochondrial adenine nucleotide transporter BTL3 [Ipomoea batatas]